MVSPTRQRLIIIASFICANVLVGWLSWRTLDRSQQQYAIRAEAATQNIASALDLSVSTTVEKIDLVLRTMTDELERQLEGKGLNDKEVNAFIERQRKRIPEIDGIRVSDADSFLILGNGVVKSAKIRTDDRDYFALLRERDDGTMWITKPLAPKVIKDYIVIFARRYNHPDGRFAGVIYATVTTSRLANLLSGFDIGANSTLILRDTDLGLIARAPALPDQPAGKVGNNAVSKELHQTLAAGNLPAVYRTKTSLDGQERIFAVRKLRSAPMFIIVGISPQDYLTGWRAESTQTGLFMAGFLLLSIFSGAMLLRLIARADKMSNFDPLTDLPNRHRLMERLGEAQTSLARQKAKLHGAIIIINIGSLKSIIETHWFTAYDELLVAVAGRLAPLASETDLIARLGNDDFAYLATALDPDETAAATQALALAEKIRATLCLPYDFLGSEHNIDVSIGVSLFTGAELAVDELLKQTEAVRRQAAASGQNAVLLSQS